MTSAVSDRFFYVGCFDNLATFGWRLWLQAFCCGLSNDADPVSHGDGEELWMVQIGLGDGLYRGWGTLDSNREPKLGLEQRIKNILGVAHLS